MSIAGYLSSRNKTELRMPKSGQSASNQGKDTLSIRYSGPVLTGEKSVEKQQLDDATRGDFYNEGVDCGPPLRERPVATLGMYGLPVGIQAPQERSRHHMEGQEVTATPLRLQNPVYRDRTQLCRRDELGQTNRSMTVGRIQAAPVKLGSFGFVMAQIGFQLALRRSAQHRSVQYHRNRALQKLHAHDHAPFVLLLQDDPFDAAQRAVSDPHALACAQKRPWPDREGGIDQRADRTDFFIRQRRRSVAESDDRPHPRHAQHRNPPCRIFESGEHVTRKQRRIQQFDAVRPDALVFVSRKKSFDLVESFQALEASNFMLWLDRQSIPG
jgi:hypothetical protein